MLEGHGSNNKNKAQPGRSWSLSAFCLLQERGLQPGWGAARNRERKTGVFPVGKHFLAAGGLAGFPLAPSTAVSKTPTWPWASPAWGCAFLYRTPSHHGQVSLHDIWFQPHRQESSVYVQQLSSKVSSQCSAPCQHTTGWDEAGAALPQDLITYKGFN